MRGRDIKRYSYDFAHLYLIITLPSLKINIEEYPAVKKFLLGFKPKIRQTGETLTLQEIELVINHAKKYGIEINSNSLKKSRKKTNNKWFETQDSIDYWEDFYKQKIIWTDISKDPKFIYTNEGIFFNNTCYMMTNIDYGILGVLNSKIIKWYFPKISTDLGNGGSRYFKQFVEMLPIPNNNLLLQEIERQIKEHSYSKIDHILYKEYGFEVEEIKLIEIL